MKKKILVPLILWLFSLWLLTRNVDAAGTIGLPFSEGEAWYVCRGYNVPRTIHENAAALDFSFSSNSSSDGGCNLLTANDSKDKIVRAPGNGTIIWFGSRDDMVCLNLDDGGSLGIGHIYPNSRPANGSRVNKNNQIGIVAEPNNLSLGNGGYAHIHIQAKAESNCPRSAETIPFDSAHGMRFEGDVPDMPWDKSIPNQWGKTSATPNGTKLSNFSATSHPDGSLIRASGDQTVWYLQNGKRRGITSADAFTKMWFSEDDVIVVSSQERDCYDVGETITTSTNPASLWPSVWNGYLERTLVQFTGVTTPERVYLVSGGFLHWLNMSWNDFISLGYKGDKIHVFDASFVRQEIFGGSFTVADFKKCENKKAPLAALTGYVGGGFQDMPNDYASTGGNPPPPPDQVVAGNGMIFVPGYYDGAGLGAFSLTGAKLWSIRGGVEIAFDGASLYAIGCDDVYKTLVRIDSATGVVQNSFRLSFDGNIGTCGTQSRMSLWSDRLYVVTPGFLYAVRKSDGALLWKRSSGYGWETDKLFDGMAMASDGSVYLSRQNATLTAINPDGTVRWSADSLVGFKHLPPQISADEKTIFFATSENEVVNNKTSVRAFSPNGVMKWEKRIEAGWYLKAVGNDGVYVKNQGGLISLNPANGNEVFRQEIGSWDSLLVGTNGNLYVPKDGYVLALSSMTGEELGRYFGDFNHTSTALALRSDGTIVAVTSLRDGGPYAIAFLAPGNSESPAPAPQPSPTPAPASQISPDIISLWSGEGNGNDATGLNNGTLQGGVTFVPGRNGQAFQFHGTSGEGIEIGDKSSLEGLTQITINAWVKTTDPNENQAIIAKHYSDNPSWIVRTSGDGLGKASCGVETDQGSSITWGEPRSATVIADGIWHFVSCAYDGREVVLYVDGRRESSAPLSGTIKNSAYHAVIGNFGNTNGVSSHTSFDGAIDEVKIYSRTLSAGEIQTLAAQ